VIPAFAREQGASLVIMGALARSKLKQRIIGSTAARALDHIPCDVLVTHVKQLP
jgi:universal stress protein E